MPIAESTDVEIRLGRTLTEAEAAMVDYVIEQMTGAIATAVGRTAAEIEATDPMPSLFKSLAVERSLTLGSNPTGLSSESKQLGAYTLTRAWRADGEGGTIFLSEAEERAVRRAYFGRVAGSARVRSMSDDLLDYAEDGIIDGS